MSQSAIKEILRESKSPLDATQIQTALKDKGFGVEETTFYANMRGLNKDIDIRCELVMVRRTMPGKTMRFPKKVWYHA